MSISTFLWRRALEQDGSGVRNFGTKSRVNQMLGKLASPQFISPLSWAAILVKNPISILIFNFQRADLKTIQWSTKQKNEKNMVAASFKAAL